MKVGKGIRRLFPKRVDDTLKKILENNGSGVQQSGKIQAQSSGDETLLIPVEQIVPNPSQPRILFKEENLKTLAESIVNRGVLQPVVVRRVSVSPPKYEIIGGERRLRAARIAGLSSIPVVIKEATDVEMRIVSLLENFQREDLNVVEKTKSIGELFNDLKSTESVAKELGLSHRIIERYMRIYRVIYASPALASVFERQAEIIDFKTAETMASLFETILNTLESNKKFFELVNNEGIKSAIKHFLQIGKDSTSMRKDKSFNIVTRKNELIFTARHDRTKAITPDGKREIQHGLEQFFAKLVESGK
jgi:ParB/RepB/Spo0J family partition protein